MIRVLLLASAILLSPSVFAQGEASDAAPHGQDQTAKQDEAKPASQLVRLDKSLTKVQDAKANGRLDEKGYQEFVAKFRDNLAEAMAGVKPTPLNTALHARILSRLGDSEQALAALGPALKQDPDSPILRVAASQVHFDQNDYPAALAEANAALAIDPANKEAQALKRFSEGRTGSARTAPGQASASTGQGAGPSRTWTPKDFAKANAQARNQNLIPGRMIDGGGVPALDAIASEIAANTPIGALSAPSDKSRPLKTAGTIALAATGALLLFGGLGGKRLEEKFPGIQRNMGIAALIGGSLATGAIAWEAHLARMTTALPIAANPALQDEATEGMTRGSATVQRIGQTTSDLGTQTEAQLDRIGSAVASRAGPLLNADKAQIEMRKLTEYALNPANTDGMHKARVFQSALGYTRDNFQGLVDQIRMGVLTNPAVQGKMNEYGTRFTVDMMVQGPSGQALVRTGWIYDPGSSIPRLTTLFVK